MGSPARPGKSVWDRMWLSKKPAAATALRATRSGISNTRLHTPASREEVAAGLPLVALAPLALIAVGLADPVLRYGPTAALPDRSW